MVSLMMALGASERREVVVIDESRTSDHLRKLLDVPEPVIIADPLCNQVGKTDLLSAEVIARIEASMPDFPNFGAPVKGRVVVQAKGPNRKQDRARGIYGKRGKR